MLGFGLIHGLGLSTRLQALGLPRDGLLARVIAFNVGIEIGQLLAITAIAVMVALVLRYWQTRTADNTGAVARVLAVCVLFGGITAVGTVLVRDLVGGPADTTAASSVEGERTLNFPPGGGHAAEDFFEPAGATPLADVDHSLADGYVALPYRPDLQESEVAALRTRATTPAGRGVLAGPVADQGAAVTAVTATTTMTCEFVDTERYRPSPTTG